MAQRDQLTSDDVFGGSDDFCFSKVVVALNIVDAAFGDFGNVCFDIFGGRAVFFA